MNLADIPSAHRKEFVQRAGQVEGLMPDIGPLPRERLEKLALSAAKLERECGELRALLLEILWPRPPVT